MARLGNLSKSFPKASTIVSVSLDEALLGIVIIASAMGVSPWALGFRRLEPSPEPSPEERRARARGKRWFRRGVKVEERRMWGMVLRVLEDMIVVCGGKIPHNLWRIWVRRVTTGEIEREEAMLEKVAEAVVDWLDEIVESKVSRREKRACL